MNWNWVWTSLLRKRTNKKTGGIRILFFFSFLYPTLATTWNKIIQRVKLLHNLNTSYFHKQHMEIWIKAKNGRKKAQQTRDLVSYNLKHNNAPFPIVNKILWMKRTLCRFLPCLLLKSKSDFAKTIKVKIPSLQYSNVETVIANRFYLEQTRFVCEAITTVHTVRTLQCDDSMILTSPTAQICISQVTLRANSSLNLETHSALK